MVALSVISLLFWVFATQLKLLEPSGIMYVDWGNNNLPYRNYYGLYFEYQTIKIWGYTGFRNTGIFCEGPMFGVCLIFAIAIELFLEPYKYSYGKSRTGGIIKLIVLSSTLLSTLTTTGAILLVIMIFIKVCTGKLMNRFKGKIIIALPLFIVVMIALKKLFLIRASYNSWAVRLNDYIVGFKAWIASPIFGAGFGNDAIFYLKYVTGYSNSIFAILSQGGVILFLLYLVPLVGIIRYSLLSKKRNLLLISCIVGMELVVTTIQYRLLLFLFLAFFYALLINVFYSNKIKS